MPVYRYRGVASGNRTVQGTIDAESPRAAREKLRADAIYPTEITAGKVRSETGEALSRLKLPTLRRVPDMDLALFSSQLSTLLSAGVPLVQGLSALTEQVENERLRAVVGQVRQSVNEGSSLAEALGEHPQVFDELYCSMVQSGESSGALDLVESRLADYVESRMTLQSKLINAMMYPALMFGASMVVAGVLLVYVIPNITTMLQDMDAELPLPTRVVLAMSGFLDQWWVYIVGGLCLGLLAFSRFIQTQRGRRWWDDMKLRMPASGRLLRFVAVSRFCRTLATLVAGGVNIVAALDISKNVAGNVVIGEAIDEAKDAITKGAPIATTLRQTGQFPPLVTHMISVGEASGELDAMLGKVSDTYDELVDNALERLLAVLGPIMLLFVASLIVAIVLSTLLPLLSLTSTL